MFSEYPDLMSIEEVREALRIGRSTVYNLVRSGKIRYFKIGSVIRIPKNCLLDYIEHNSYNEFEADRRP